MSKIKMGEFENIDENILNKLPETDINLINENEFIGNNINTIKDNEEDNNDNNKEDVTDNKTTLESLIDPSLAIDLIDFLIPSIAFLIINKIGYYFNKESLKLSSGEKKALIPAMNKVLNSMQINITNPFYNFLIVFGIIYASKIIDIAPNFKKIEKNIVVNNKIKYESEYNNLIDRVCKERNLSAALSKKWIEKNMTETLKDMKLRYNISDESDNNIFGKENEDHENII